MVAGIKCGAGSIVSSLKAGRENALGAGAGVTIPYRVPPLTSKCVVAYWHSLVKARGNDRRANIERLMKRYSFCRSCP